METVPAVGTRVVFADDVYQRKTVMRSGTVVQNPGREGNEVTVNGNTFVDVQLDNPPRQLRNGLTLAEIGSLEVA